MSGGIRLSLQCEEHCTDPSLESRSPLRWSRELVPLVASASSETFAQQLQAAPAYSCVVIGRRPNCFIPLTDQSISGHHCQLTLVRPPIVKGSPTAGSDEVAESHLARRPLPHGCGSDDVSDSGRGELDTISCYIADNSTNGTFVDGRRLRKGVPFKLAPRTSLVSLGRNGPDKTFAFRIFIEESLPPRAGGGLKDAAGAAAAIDLTLAQPHAASSELSDTEGGGDNDLLMPPAPSCMGHSASVGGKFGTPDSLLSAAGGVAPTVCGSGGGGGCGGCGALDTQPAGAKQQANLTLRIATARLGAELQQDQGLKCSPGENNRRQSTPPRSRWNCSTTQSTMSSSGILTTNATNDNGGRNSGSRLSEVIKRLQEDNAKKDDEIAEIAEELDCSEVARKSLQTQHAVLTKELAQAREALSQVEAQYTEARNAIAEQSAQVAALHRQLERAQTAGAAAAEEAARDASRWRDRASNWEAQHASLQRRLEACQAQLQDALEEKGEVRNRLTDTLAVVEELEVKHRQAVSALDAARTEVNEIRRAADAAALEAENRESRSDKLLKQALNRAKASEAAQAQSANEVASLRHQMCCLVASEEQLQKELANRMQQLREASEASAAQHELVQRTRRMATTLTELIRQSYTVASSLTQLHTDDTFLKTPPTTRMKVDATDHVDQSNNYAAAFQNSLLMGRCLNETRVSETGDTICCEDDKTKPNTHWPACERSLHVKRKTVFSGRRSSPLEPILKRCRDERPPPAPAAESVRKEVCDCPATMPSEEAMSGSASSRTSEEDRQSLPDTFDDGLLAITPVEEEGTAKDPSDPPMKAPTAAPTLPAAEPDKSGMNQVEVNTASDTVTVMDSLLCPLPS